MRACNIVVREACVRLCVCEGVHDGAVPAAAPHLGHLGHSTVYALQLGCADPQNEKEGATTPGRTPIPPPTDLAPAHTTATGVRPSSVRSALTSQLTSPPLRQYEKQVSGMPVPLP